MIWADENNDRIRYQKGTGASMLTKKDQLEIELIKTYYQTSRANLANRLRIRDNSIIIFIAVISVLFGVSFTREVGFYEMPLLIIPAISFGITILVNYHNEYIARIVHYLGNDLYEEIRNLDISITEWSFAHGHLELQKNKWLGADHAVAEKIILVVPSVFSLILTLNSFIAQVVDLFTHRTTGINQVSLWGWIIGLVCLILIITTHIKANRFKANIYSKLPGREQNKT